jgi:hypothetical protein
MLLTSWPDTDTVLLDWKKHQLPCDPILDDGHAGKLVVDMEHPCG